MSLVDFEYDSFHSYTLIIVLFSLYLISRFLHLQQRPEAPQLYGRDHKFLEHVRKTCPLLAEPYIPPVIWGRSGHVQTWIHSGIGRLKLPGIEGERIPIVMADGSTLTYDLYQPTGKSGLPFSIVVAVCPGIGNSGETAYIRTLVHGVQRSGFHCAVLNHLGVVDSVKLTAPRIFLQSLHFDYEAMIKDLLPRIHAKPVRVVALGYSLGGNLITKYLGDKANDMPPEVMGGISICQGYDACRLMGYMLKWENLRRLYFYVMSEEMKRIIFRNRHWLLTEDMKETHNLDEKKIAAAGTMVELDEAFTRRVNGCSSVVDYYRKASCIQDLNKVSKPILLINAEDDPIVPKPLLEIPKSHAASHDRSLYVEVKNGGHLGFFEGGYLVPRSRTWLERTVVQMVESIATYEHGFSFATTSH